MAAVELSEAETRVVSALLERAWGPGAQIRGVAPIWNRSHVLRVRAGPDRSVVMKRRDPKTRPRSFGVELAALEYLNAMPVPVAPRLVAADAEAGILLMEDLGPGASLADALLGGDRERAQASLVAYAEALGAMHAWSMGRPGELADLRARYAPEAPLGPSWLEALARGRASFAGAMGSLGLAANGTDAEIGEIPYLLNGAGYLGLVHGDGMPGQRAVPRRWRPDLRLRDLGVGPGGAGRRLPAGAVPELLVLRPVARRGGRAGYGGVSRANRGRGDRAGC